MHKILMLLLAASVSCAYAGEAEIRQSLQKKVPQIGPINQVSKSPVPGLYEVVTQDHLFYTDEKGQFLIDGAVFDLKTMRNLTEERSRKLFALDFNKLPLELAVKIVKGKGERKLAIFTDPNWLLKRSWRRVAANRQCRFTSFYPVFPGSEEGTCGMVQQRPRQGME
jgi:thiol:disulfide interchange protein DsbC